MLWRIGVLKLKDSFTLTKNYLTLDIETCQNEVFREKGFTVIKDFISKDAAIIIKKLLLKNEKCFSKESEEGNAMTTYDRMTAITREEVDKIISQYPPPVLHSELGVHRSN